MKTINERAEEIMRETDAELSRRGMRQEADNRQGPLLARIAALVELIAMQVDERMGRIEHKLNEPRSW